MKNKLQSTHNIITFLLKKNSNKLKYFLLVVFPGKVLKKLNSL